MLTPDVFSMGLVGADYFGTEGTEYVRQHKSMRVELPWRCLWRMRPRRGADRLNLYPASRGNRQPGLLQSRALLLLPRKPL